MKAKHVKKPMPAKKAKRGAHKDTPYSSKGDNGLPGHSGGLKPPRRKPTHFAVPDSTFDVEHLEQEDLDFFRDHPDYLDHFDRHVDVQAITKKPSRREPAAYKKNVTVEALNVDDNNEDDEEASFQQAVGRIKLNPKPDEPGSSGEEPTANLGEQEHDDDDEIHQELIESEEEGEESESGDEAGESELDSEVSHSEELGDANEEEEEEEEAEEVEALRDVQEKEKDVQVENKVPTLLPNLPKKRKIITEDENEEDEYQEELESDEADFNSEEDADSGVDEDYEDDDDDDEEEEEEVDDEHDEGKEEDEDDEAEESEDTDYETQYQLKAMDRKEPTPQLRLPIKTQEGRIVQPETSSQHTPGSTRDPLATTKKQKEPSASTTPPPSPPPAPAVPPVRQMALLANDLLNDPHQHVASLGAILAFLKPSEETGPTSASTQSAAVLVLCQTFLDLIPGYLIKPLTETQRQEKVTKDIRQVRRYEEQFLKYYQSYLVQLERVSKQVGTPLASVAVLALCRLLEQHPHFNFRKNILHVLLHRVTQKKARPTIVATLLKLFQNDKEGAVSSEAVRILGRLVKQSKYKVHPDVFRTLEHLRLKDELTLEEAYGHRRTNSLSSKGLARNTKCTRKQRKLGLHQTPYMNRKQGKQNKFLKEAEKSIKLAQATVDVEERNRHHRVCLEHLFLTYFRVLKNAPQSRLLSPVLDGLQIFAHLISVDFFHSLLGVLRAHLEAAWVQPAQQLQMIYTVDFLSKGQGEFVNLDVSSMYTACYQLLHTLTPWSPSLPSTLTLLCQFLDRVTVFQSTDPLSLKRAAAFFIQWQNVLLLLDHPHWLLASLALLHSWLVKCPRLRDLFDPLADRCVSGTFVQTALDPLLANALAATPWPFLLLLRHWHPEVRSLTTTILHNLRAKCPVAVPAWHFFSKQWDWKDGRDALVCFNTSFVNSSAKKGASRHVGGKKKPVGKVTHDS